jgi:hypothetical protein
MDDSLEATGHSTSRVDQSSAVARVVGEASVLHGWCARFVGAQQVQPRGDAEGSTMSNREAPNGNAADLERTEQDRQRARRSRDAKVRFALDLLLESGLEGGATPILGALAAHATDEDGHQAYEMAIWAVRALVFKDPQALASARQWHARQRGCDSSQHAISIIKLNDAVESAVHVIQLGDVPLFPKKQAVLEQLSEHINSTFGPPAAGGHMPSPADLEQWISRHGSSRRRKEITTAGIVAAIVHQARLFGTRGQSLPSTRSRVDSALRRKREAERAIRERFVRT